jgi:hypothetical protein
LIPKGALLVVCRIWWFTAFPASVTGFAEGELSQPSDKFVGGKSTMEKAVYFGPGTPPNTDWHHYTDLGEQLLVVPIDVLGHEGLDAARAATGAGDRGQRNNVSRRSGCELSP